MPDYARLETLDVRGVAAPRFLYGTAWKEQSTAILTAQALDAGFRGIDTANQRKHYHEAGVGVALREWVQAGRRDALFVQTKFTYRRGQDERLPYDPDAPIAEQVRQSFVSSLEHLGLERLDSLVLHGPWSGEGIAPQDIEAWGAMQALQAAGQVRLLGISNVRAEQLQELLQRVGEAPAFVQNRCYARRGWDQEVRQLCEDAGVVYQGFSLLTANRATWNHPWVADIARRLGATPAQVIFRFAMHEGVLPLTGSSDSWHLQQDLEAASLTLEPSDIRTLYAVEAQR